MNEIRKAGQLLFFICCVVPILALFGGCAALQGKPTEVQVNDGTIPETEASVHIRKLSDSGSPSPSTPPGGVQQ